MRCIFEILILAKQKNGQLSIFHGKADEKKIVLTKWLAKYAESKENDIHILIYFFKTNHHHYKTKFIQLM
jgi:hypothetical protein